MAFDTLKLIFFRNCRLTFKCRGLLLYFPFTTVIILLEFPWDLEDLSDKFDFELLLVLNEEPFPKFPFE